MKSHKEFKPTLRGLGQIIYHCRVLKNYSAKQIAPMISLTPEAYRNIEKGACDVSFTTLLMITKILEIDFTDLISNLPSETINVRST